MQRCFIKAGETYFSNSKTLFSTVPKDINLEDMGLVKTKNVIPAIYRKWINIISRLMPCSVMEIEPLSYVFLLITKKRQTELEEIESVSYTHLDVYKRQV